MTAGLGDEGSRPPAPSPLRVKEAREHVTGRFARGVDWFLWETYKRPLADVEAVTRVLEAAGDGRAIDSDLSAALVLVRAAILDLERLTLRTLLAARQEKLSDDAIAVALDLPFAAAAQRYARWLTRQAALPVDEIDLPAVGGTPRQRGEQARRRAQAAAERAEQAEFNAAQARYRGEQLATRSSTQTYRSGHREPDASPSPTQADPADRIQALTRQVEELKSAIVSRDVIGQAKGMLMHRFQLTGQQAFQVLAAASNHHNTKVIDLASAIVTVFEADPRTVASRAIPWHSSTDRLADALAWVDAIARLRARPEPEG